MDRLPCYLAIDIGGTSTRAAVAEADGSVTGYGAAGGGNPTASGPAAAAAAIVAAATAALRQAGRTAGGLAGAVAGIAGSGGRVGVALHEELVRAGLPPALSFQPDLLATFCSGALADQGYAVVAGTGAIAARVRGRRLEATSDGLGWLLGDGGSGFWIGHRVVRAVAAALDGRGPPTALLAPTLAELGVAPEPAGGEPGGDFRSRSLRDLIEAVYGLRPVELARCGRLAFAATAAGDEVAAAIVAEAAGALATTAGAVVRPDIAGPVVLGGGLLAGQPVLADAVRGALTAQGVTGPFVVVGDGVAGAAVLALRAAGVTVDETVMARLQTTLATRR